MSHTEMSQMSIMPMIVISMAAALLSTMNIWTNKFGHVRLHLNDIFMAILMTSWMFFLQGVYFMNTTMIIFGFLGIIITIYLIRNQVFINDCQFMKGMIPHHSMAVLMAEQIKQKSDNKDVIDLANNIIASQNEEINYMQKLGY